jgi:hypothetical protein
MQILRLPFSHHAVFFQLQMQRSPGDAEAPGGFAFISS